MFNHFKPLTQVKSHGYKGANLSYPSLAHIVHRKSYVEILNPQASPFSKESDFSAVGLSPQTGVRARELLMLHLHARQEYVQKGYAERRDCDIEAYPRH